MVKIWKSLSICQSLQFDIEFNIQMVIFALEIIYICWYYELESYQNKETVNYNL